MNIGDFVNEAGGDMVTSQSWVLDYLQLSGARGTRAEMLLNSHFTSWDEKALHMYEYIFDRIKSRNLNLSVLIGLRAHQGTQAEHVANSAEYAGGNGNNPYIQALIADSKVILNRLGKYIDTVEVGNEPTNYKYKLYESNYAQLLDGVYKNVKAANPGIKVIAGNVETMDGNSGGYYMGRVIARGKELLGWSTLPADLVGAHPYVTPDALVTEEHIVERVNSLRYYLPTDMPIAFTEFGWQSAGIGLQAQADNIAMMMSTIAKHPELKVTVANVYRLNDTEESWGLINGAGGKPAFETFKAGAANLPK
jgi:hypothetical protein